MNRLTERDGRIAVRVGGCTKRNDPVFDKLAHYEDLEEAGELLTIHQAAVIISAAFGDEHPCNFNSIDEWFPNACNHVENCPDVVGADCWEQYIKIKLADRKSVV